MNQAAGSGISVANVNSRSSRSRPRWSVIAAMAVAVGILASLYQPVRAHASTPQVEISFLPIQATLNWSQARWDQEFSDLKNSGIAEIVSDGAVFREGSTDVAYYPASLPGMSIKRNNSGAASDQILTLLQTARKYGFKVWLGTYIPSSEWYSLTDANVAQAAHENATRTAAILKDIDGKYGAYASIIAGWYLGSEISASWAWSWTATQALKSYFKTLYDAAQLATLSKKTLVSPYYNIDALGDPGLWTKMWESVLLSAPLSVIALQDGVGDESKWMSSSVQKQRIATKYAATQKAITQSGARTSLWANMDLYDIYGFTRPALDVAATRSIEAPYVSRFLSWSFSAQISPWALGTNAYYNPFKAWNISGSLPPATVAAPSNFSVSSSAGVTTVDWPDVAAGAYPIAYYRIFTLTGEQLDVRFVSSWSGTGGCAQIQAVDVAGNVSAKVPTC